MTLVFLNGGGMRGGDLHSQLEGAALVAAVRTAARYRFSAVDDRYPALEEVGPGGGAVEGELYDLPLDVLGRLLAAEPPELELGVVELADGAAVLGFLLRREHTRAASLVDITAAGSWRAHRG